MCLLRSQIQALGLIFHPLFLFSSTSIAVSFMSVTPCPTRFWQQAICLSKCCAAQQSQLIRMLWMRTTEVEIVVAYSSNGWLRQKLRFTWMKLFFSLVALLCCTGLGHGVIFFSIPELFWNFSDS